MKLLYRFHVVHVLLFLVIISLAFVAFSFRIEYGLLGCGVFAFVLLLRVAFWREGFIHLFFSGLAGAFFSWLAAHLEWVYGPPHLTQTIAFIGLGAGIMAYYSSLIFLHGSKPDTK